MVASALAKRAFYTTEAAPCPYLPNRREQRLVTTLLPDAQSSLSHFAELGFRRSQSFLYRPMCDSCSACVPVRIVVAGFRPSRNLRKVLQRNDDLLVELKPAISTDEQFELFARYQAARHGHGSMREMNRLDYALMIEDAPGSTMVMEARFPDGRLAAVSLTDRLVNGLSGVYKFFDPDVPKRSLGTFVILWHVLAARGQGLPFVYLGYWVKGSPTMDYKVRFQPLERYDGKGWHAMVDAAPEGVDHPQGGQGCSSR